MISCVEFHISLLEKDIDKSQKLVSDYYEANENQTEKLSFEEVKKYSVNIMRKLVHHMDTLYSTAVSYCIDGKLHPKMQPEGGF